MFKRVVHPGEILCDELGTTLLDFSRETGVPLSQIQQIIGGSRSISEDAASRFGNWFGVDSRFWLNLQTQYDLAIANGRD